MTSTGWRSAAATRFLDGDRTVCGQQLHGVGIAECLDALLPVWQEAGPRIAAFNAANSTVKRGLGVASCWYGCGNTALPNPSTVRLGITADGRFVLHQGATDIGQGSNTVITQICADALGMPLADFELVGPDTALTPDCGKTGIAPDLHHRQGGRTVGPAAAPISCGSAT